MTLIAADAGFGKSTLVVSFLASEDRPAVWYRLDSADNDPAVFAAHLLHGLRPHVARNAYQSARRGLSLAFDWSAAAQLLSLAIQRLQRDVIIVLDDFHLLAGSGLTQGMTSLIDALPLRGHLAILTRVLPDLPLSRWRVQGRLAEFGADDLRFTVAELRALLVDLHGLPLSDASLHVVAARTEGWPAGIVLALHTATAQGAAAASQALGTISGSTREIYEYLAQEAFTRQTPETQQFMLATAAVARFSLPLADALLGSAGGRNREVLDHLERSHLFIVALDRERRWYRYHHLFQEFLQRTAADRDPGWVREVHLRSAGWWERNGEAGETLYHLVAAGEFLRAAELLGRVGLDMVPQGRMETLRRWLGVIPEEHWQLAPRLYLIRGLTEVTSGDSRQAAVSLEEARRRLLETGDTEGEIYALRWLVNVAVWEGGADMLVPAINAVSEVAGRLNQFTGSSKAAVLELMARAAQLRGEMHEAEQLFGEAVRTARSSNDDWAYLGCLRYQANFFWALARFREAEILFEEVLELSHGRGWWHEHAHFHVELAGVFLSAGRNNEAERQLAEARLLQPSIPCRVLQADLALTAGQSAARRGALALAETLLRELLNEGKAGTRYGRFRFDARIELAALLAATEPAEARQVASLALGVAHQFDPIRAAHALLSFGIVARSVEHCRQAASVFDGLQARHWSTIAMLHAAALAPAEGKADLSDAALVAMCALPDESWNFLFAHAPPDLLVPYRSDPVVGPRIVNFQPTTSLAAPSRIMVRCFGSFEVIRDGRVLGQDDWQRAAPKRLVQYLLLQDRPVHREEVIEALWPDLEPGHGANQLRVALSQLRRVLEPELIPRRPSSLVLTSGPTIVLARDRLDADLDRFRRALARASSSEVAVRRAALTEAVALHTGDLFADHPFEEWAQPHRDRLGRQYLDALTLLAEADESEEDHQAAVLRWLTVIERDPAAENAYRGLIRAYLVLGRVADALRAFESCQRAMAELDAVPSPETLRLRDRIAHVGKYARG